MKYYFLTIVLFCTMLANAALHTVTSGTGTFHTLQDVSEHTFVAGDTIAFHAGETFTGSLTLGQSGTSGNPIVFTKYGTGSDPIITGFTTVTSWTNLGSNIWESTNAVSTLSTCNMVSINGVNTSKGRYPNPDATWGGFLTIDSHTGTTSITHNAFTGNPNWTGAEVVMKINGYVTCRTRITNQSEGTLTCNTADAGTPADTYGFFIQDDIRTLDQQNEWYYNPSTKKISIYSASQPVNVKVASVENLFEYLTPNNVTQGNWSIVENITFEGANNNALSIAESRPYLNHATIQNCNIKYTGVNAIQIKGDYLEILNNNIQYSNRKAIEAPASTNVTIKDNIIDSSGLLYGMAGSGFYGATCAVSVGSEWITPSPILVENNRITNTALNGIHCQSGIVTIKNNFIDTYCVNGDDGAGIYSWHTSGVEIVGNIIINGIGDVNGRTGTFPIQACGIYLDELTNNCSVHGNSVYNATVHGIFMNEARNIDIYDNTVFDTKNIRTENAPANQLAINSSSDPLYQATEMNVYNNIFVAKSNQIVAGFQSTINNLTLMGSFRNNYYAMPENPNGNLFWVQQPNQTDIQDKTLSEWKSFSGQDSNSKLSPQIVSSVNDLQFEYNSTTSPKPITLSRPMMDVKGNKYAKSVTLQSFTSVVLMKDLTPRIYLKFAGKIYHF